MLVFSHETSPHPASPGFFLSRQIKYSTILTDAMGGFHCVDGRVIAPSFRLVNEFVLASNSLWDDVHRKTTY